MHQIIKDMSFLTENIDEVEIVNLEKESMFVPVKMPENVQAKIPERTVILSLPEVGQEMSIVTGHLTRADGGSLSFQVIVKYNKDLSYYEHQESPVVREIKEAIDVRSPYSLVSINEDRITKFAVDKKDPQMLRIYIGNKYCENVSDRDTYFITEQSLSKIA